MTTNSNAAEETGGFQYYHYDPSMPAAIVFIIAFLISALYHVYLVFSQRTWYFVVFVLGCLFETVGYLGRAISASETPKWTLNPYLIQSILLLLGPSLLAASIYMVLGRLIVLLGAEQHSLIRTKWLTKIFVAGDVLSFLAQGGGGGILATAKSPDTVKQGENIIILGLGIQIVFFGLFMIATLVFHIRIATKPTPKSLLLLVPWKSLLYVLYAASLLIMVRSVFRMAEYVQGAGGELQSRELYIYLLDALLMAIVCGLFNWFHPSRVLNSNSGMKSLSSLEALDNSYIMDDQLTSH